MMSEQKTSIPLNLMSLTTAIIGAVIIAIGTNQWNLNKDVAELRQIVAVQTEILSRLETATGDRYTADDARRENADIRQFITDEYLDLSSRLSDISKAIKDSNTANNNRLTEYIRGDSVRMEKLEDNIDKNTIRYYNLKTKISKPKTQYLDIDENE